MSSLVRRIQRMPKRDSFGAKKRMFTRHVGDKLGVKPKDNKKAKRAPRGCRRRTKPSLRPKKGSLS